MKIKLKIFEGLKEKLVLETNETIYELHFQELLLIYKLYHTYDVHFEHFDHKGAILHIFQYPFDVLVSCSKFLETAFAI